ncbi:type IV pilin N-terminal domain-containing protein [Halosimplex amylolyticum]|uniref:type IV pilin N-terminal domain-containing protein n=1 Tax=Halosimplex amylolyticum TaxID=3396616 RepID=UPI003F55543B
MDGDTALNAVGVVLVLAIVAGFVVVGLNFAGGASGSDAPDADWTVERINDTAVRVTHAGGEPVRTDEIRVTVDSVSRSTDWTDPVTENESTVVQANDGSLVRIVWNGGRGDRERMHSERL